MFCVKCCFRTIVLVELKEKIIGERFILIHVLAAALKLMYMYMHNSTAAHVQYMHNSTAAHVHVLLTSTVFLILVIINFFVRTASTKRMHSSLKRPLTPRTREVIPVFPWSSWNWTDFSTVCLILVIIACSMNFFQLSNEKEKILAMKKHLNISFTDIDDSLAKYDMSSSAVATPPTPSSTSSSASNNSSGRPLGLVKTTVHSVSRVGDVQGCVILSLSKMD